MTFNKSVADAVAAVLQLVLQQQQQSGQLIRLPTDPKVVCIVTT